MGRKGPFKRSSQPCSPFFIPLAARSRSLLVATMNLTHGPNGLSHSVRPNVCVQSARVKPGSLSSTLPFFGLGYCSHLAEVDKRGLRARHTWTPTHLPNQGPGGKPAAVGDPYRRCEDTKVLEVQKGRDLLLPCNKGGGLSWVSFVVE